MTSQGSTGPLDADEGLVDPLAPRSPPSPPEPPSRSPAGPEEPLKVKALKVALWRIGGFGTSQVIRLVSNIILARLLLPSDFGLAALVIVWIQGLEMFSDIGLGPGVVQSRRGDEPDYVNTAWTMGLIRGVCLWLIACGLAMPMALLYGEPVLAAMMPVFALTALLGGLNSMSTTLLTRHMKAGYIAFIDIGGQVSGATVMIVWALNAPNVWALVAGGVAGAAVRVLLSHLLVIVPVAFRWEAEARRELFHFGKWIFISTVITFFAMQSDKLIGGKIIPLDMFGVYAIAFSLTNMPKMVVNRISRSAIFPMFAIAARSSPERLQAQFAQARRVLLPIMFVLVLGVVAGGRLFFQILYTDEYQDAGWMSQCLAMFLWFTIITEASDRVLLALGDSRTLAVANGVRTVVTIAGVIGGYLAAGMLGFIMGLAAGALAGYLVIAVALQRRGLPILAGDAAHTAALAAVALASIWLFDLTAPAPGPRQFAGAAVTVLVPGLWALWSVYQAYGRKRRSDGAT